MQINFDAANKLQNLNESMPEEAVGSGPVPTDMVHVDPFDTAPAKAKFLSYEIEINEMLAWVKNHKVTDDESNLLAVEVATQSKKFYNQIEKLRKTITDEPRQFTSAINNFAKVYTSQLKEIESTLKNQISSYAHKVEMVRREAEQKAQEEAKKLQAKIDKEAKAKNIEPVHVPEPVLPTKAEPTRTESGSASIRKSWTWKEVDISKVPHEYLMLDKIKINKAVRAGIRTISGIEIYEESTTVLRT